MANTKSAQKAQRQAERRAQRTRPIRSAIRTHEKKATLAVATAEEQAAEIVRVAVKAIDKAAQKGIIHKNNAARRKSRLMKSLNAVGSAPVAEATVEKKPAAKRTTARAGAKTTTRRTTTTTSTTARGGQARAAAALRTAATRATRTKKTEE